MNEKNQGLDAAQCAGPKASTTMFGTHTTTAPSLPHVVVNRGYQPPPPTPDTVTITISREDAEALGAAAWGIGYNGEASERPGVTDVLRLTVYTKQYSRSGRDLAARIRGIGHAVSKALGLPHIGSYISY